MSFQQGMGFVRLHYAARVIGISIGDVQLDVDVVQVCRRLSVRTGELELYVLSLLPLEAVLSSTSSSVVLDGSTALLPAMTPRLPLHLPRRQERPHQGGESRHLIRQGVLLEECMSVFISNSKNFLREYNMFLSIEVIIIL